MRSPRAAEDGQWPPVGAASGPQGLGCLLVSVYVPHPGLDSSPPTVGNRILHAM